MDIKQTVTRLFEAMSSGKTAQAKADTRALLEVRAPLAKHWLSVAQAMSSIGEVSLARQALQGFVASGSAGTEGIVKAAALLSEDRRLDDALSLLNSCHQREPNNPTLNHFLGTLNQQLGNVERAEQHLQASLAKAPIEGISWLTLSAQKDFSKDEAAFQALSGIEQKISQTPAENYAPYLYARSKAALDRGEEAFDFVSQAGRLLGPHRRFDGKADRQQAEAIARNFATVNCADSDDAPQPIFIVGLPRSGTTLLEQILCSHSEVVDGGEFSAMQMASRVLGPLQDVSAAQLAQSSGLRQSLRDHYRHLAAERFVSKGRIVDKSMSNSRFLGVIASIFPKAPIIHIERDLDDVAWSCFRTYFSNGLNWSYKLEDIASHFKAEADLMDHWHRVLGKRILRVSYADLIRDSDAQIAALLKHCDLTDDPKTRDFHLTARPILTASVAQVKQALYSKAIGSAAAVGNHLKPFRDQLVS